MHKLFWLLMLPGAVLAQNAGTMTDSKLSVPVFSWRMSTLSQCIKVDPTGCTMQVVVEAQPCYQRIVAVSTTTTVAYAENGRNDSTTSGEAWAGNDCRVVLVETMDGKVLGGSVATSATARLSDGRTASAQQADTFLGNNPANADVRAAIGNPTYSVVAYDRSRFKQFGPDGRPVFVKGFGIMQVVSPDAEQVWHWKRNVEAGKQSLDAAWKEAGAYPAKMRASGYPRIPDFSGKEQRMFALQSLVGEFYYVPNTNGRQWIPNKGRSDYADSLARLESDVAAGKPPSDW